MVHDFLDGLTPSSAATLADSVPQAWISRFAQPLQTCSSGPLSGLRFAVKDNMDVQGLPTTAACAAFGYTPQENATVVHRLLKTGAALVGKTNLDQFACGLNGTRSPSKPCPEKIVNTFLYLSRVTVRANG